MGNDLAGARESTIGKPTTATDSYDWTTPVVGKLTLVDRVYGAMAYQRQLASDVLHLARYAGERVQDVAHYEYEVQQDGSFLITNEPPNPRRSVIGRPIRREQNLKAWALCRELVLAKFEPDHPEATGSTPSTTSHPATSPTSGPPPTAPAHAPRAAAPSVAKLREQEKTLRASEKQDLDTLSVALAKIDKDGKSTRYERPQVETADSKKMVAGADDATAFWCSGFSMWTLAASGFDMTQVLRGDDGKPYWFTSIAKSDSAENAKASRNKFPALNKTVETELGELEFAQSSEITLRKVIDGYQDVARALRSIQTQQLKRGWVGVFRAEGGLNQLMTDGSDGYGATGAQTAFEAFGIGISVTEADQKPGDFAQMWWKRDGTYNPGHAFQVFEVVATGDAVFGQPRSPQPVPDAALTGWHHTTFRITKDTDPALVGTHHAIKASRAEANTASGFPKGSDGKLAADAADGGILTSEEKPVPATNGRVFYGRLASSAWSEWKAATRPT